MKPILIILFIAGISTALFFTACKEGSSSSVTLNGRAFEVDMVIIEREKPLLTDTIYFENDSMITAQTSISLIASNPYTFTVVNDTIIWQCTLTSRIEDAVMNFTGKVYGNEIEGNVSMVMEDNPKWEYAFFGTLIGE